MAMDGTYFVGRNELLHWINSTLHLNLTKIEQTSSGAVSCQLLDALYPGKVPLSKVDFNAKTEYDMINNYKVLQNAFLKFNIDKTPDVNKLIKGRPLDNIEFMQWFKSYFDQQTGGQEILDYDAVGRRATCKTGDLKGAAGARAPAARARAAAPPARKPAAPKASAAAPAAAAPKRAAAASPSAPDAAATAAAQEEMKELNEKLSALNVSYEEVNQERDFYYSKLRDIEILCQDTNISSIPIIKQIERILYAEDEASGTAVLNEALLQYGSEAVTDPAAEPAEPVAE